MMAGYLDMRREVLCLTLVAFLWPLAAADDLVPEEVPAVTELHVYLNNTDHVSGKELTLDEKLLSILTPHCGRVTIERSAIKGISSDADHAGEVLEFIGETDVVHNLNGDRLSGEIVEIKDDTLFIKAFFAGEKIAEVKVKKLDYLCFASQEKAQPPADLDEVRAIFTNGDVISGKIVGFDGGEFILDPPYSEKLRFDAATFRSLHNAKKSREFLQEGIAGALMDVLEKSGESKTIYAHVYPALVKSFLKDGDRKGALLIFRRVSSYINDQYVFRRIGDEFLANDMLEAAVQAYNKILEKSATQYYAYTAYNKLFNAYVKMGKLSEAAGIYEQMLSNPILNLGGYGVKIAQVRMELSDVYMKLEEFDKAAEQLRLVMASPTEQEDVRKSALSKLVGLFKQLGKIETLTERYNAELAKNDRALGESYLQMVKIYLDQGKVMKAGSYVKRLDEIGLSEYAEKGRRLIEE